ncbi:MAG: DUF1330 domain-containing protein [Alphaproteobacteria bacterium]|jgi:uncharacterized protein (DUF1330 family)|nr:DUF1330 domain-containing protein [Alphaproteobacteria bacterium]
MAAYIIVQIDVTDPDAYEVYRAQVPPIIEQYGGEYVVRGGDQEILEGDWPYPRCVVLKFPTREQAKAFHGSVEYEGPKALRHAASSGNMIVVDGV